MIHNFNFISSPLEQFKDPRYQIVVVMLLVPLIMNIIQFWITDTILKNTETYSLIDDHFSLQESHNYYGEM